MKKMNLFIILFIALAVIMFFPSCKEETPTPPKPDTKAWVTKFLDITKTANDIEGEEARGKYLIDHLPKTPILVDNLEFTNEANIIIKEEMSKVRIAELEEKFKDNQEEKDKAIADFKNSLKDHNVIVIDGEVAIISEIGCQQLKDGSWAQWEDPNKK